MESFEYFVKFCNCKCNSFISSIGFINTNIKGGGKNYTWCIVILLLIFLNISYSTDYFPKIIETNNAEITIPLFTNDSDKVFKIKIDDEEYTVNVKKCIIEYFTYNFKDFKIGDSKKIFINNEIVLVRFVENPSDYYDELFSKAVCYSDLKEITKDIIIDLNKTVEKVKNEKKFEDLLNNINEFITSNIFYISISIILVFSAVLIYILKNKIFL